MKSIEFSLDQICSTDLPDQVEVNGYIDRGVEYLGTATRVHGDTYRAYAIIAGVSMCIVECRINPANSASCIPSKRPELFP